MLRSGRVYQDAKVVREMEEERDEIAGASGRESETTKDVGMAELLRLLVEDRRAREREGEKQMRIIREHMDSLMKFVESSHRTTPLTETTRALGHGPANKLDAAHPAKLTDSDDIEAYILTFERLMAAYGVEKAHWVVRLAPQLSGKAQQAYAAMPTEEAGQYDRVKEAILRRYNINAETYRQRFRSATRKEDESYRQLAVRLGDLAKWTKGCKTAEEMADLIAIEQSLPTGVRIWFSERKPDTVAAAGQLADDYVLARKRNADSGKGDPIRDGAERPIASKRCGFCGRTGHVTKECRTAARAGSNGQGEGGTRPEQPQQQQSRGRGPRCFNGAHRS